MRAASAFLESVILFFGRRERSQPQYCKQKKEALCTSANTYDSAVSHLKKFYRCLSMREDLG
jgi:hypothetical protein